MRKGRVCYGEKGEKDAAIAGSQAHNLPSLFSPSNLIHISSGGPRLPLFLPTKINFQQLCLNTFPQLTSTLYLFFL